MQKMLGQLAGGRLERMKESSAQEREYLENVVYEGDQMLINWKQIQQLIQERLALA